jgi:hypothetical protein
LTSRWPGTLAPVSTLGPQATSLKTTAPKPLLRSRPHAKKTFGKVFGATTGRNRCAGGKAATVAGYAGPGFHTWPSGHIPQDNGSESASPQPVPCQKDVRRGVRRRDRRRDRGQRPTATKDPNPEQRRRRRRRHCSRVRWPRFPQLALRPHPSRHGSESASPHPVPCQKDVRRGVRRGDRGQRPTATKDPNPEQRRRRQSRHCSWARRPRFPHLALRPHPSRHGSESASPHPVPCQKDVRRGVRRRDWGQRPTATKDPNPEPLRRRQSRHCSRARRPRFPHLALRPHPSRQRLRNRFSAAGPMPKRRSARRSAPRPGSATHGYKRSESGTTAQAATPPL